MVPTHHAAGRRGSGAAGAAILSALCSCFLLSGCGPEAAPPPLLPDDLRPPVLLGFSAEGKRSLRLEFDEDASIAPGSLGLYRNALPRIEPESVAGSPGKSPEILWPAELEAGAEYRLEGTALDAAGNSLDFYLSFYGFNPRLPNILINELRSDSSSPKCDVIELYVKKGGFSGGLCLCFGLRDDYDWRYLFPAMELSAGEYLILHLKADESGAGKDETGSALDASGGIDASPAARDLWYPGQEGLVKGNGVVSLYENPAGGLMDAFLYSDRRKDSDAKYGGFGSEKLRSRVKALVAAGGWKIAAAEPVPEDCASSAGTTESRSMCRSPDSADSDAGADWHVVPTKGATFGSANDPRVYAPAAAAKAPKTGRGKASR